MIGLTAASSASEGRGGRYATNLTSVNTFSEVRMGSSHGPSAAFCFRFCTRGRQEGQEGTCISGKDDFNSILLISAQMFSHVFITSFLILSVISLPPDHI